MLIQADGTRVRTPPPGTRQAKAGTPGIVPSIEFFDRTATSVSVRWGQPSDGGIPGMPLTGFGLKFWKEGIQEPGWGPDDVQLVGPPPTPSEYTKTGMERGARYNFRIHACNGVDSCGYWTEPPKKVGVPLKPHSISVVDRTSTSARVKWSPEADTGGVDLTRFGIRWREIGDPWPTHAQATPGPRARRYTMTGLTENTTYEVIIQSCNGQDSCSPWNSLDNPYQFTTQEPEKIVDPPPGPVDRLWFTGFGGGTLDVEWTAADPGSTRPIVYKLEYRQNSTGTWTSVPDIPANTTQHTFSGLIDGTEYDVRVQACNDNTDDPCGDWVAPVCGVPGTTTVPGQAVLEAGDVTVAGSGELRVTWDPPTCVSAITLYEVQHKAETAASWSNPSNEIDSDTFTVEIGGLTVGTPYQVQVRACNTAITTTPSDFRDFQCGSWSDIQPGTPSGTPLPTPENLDVVPLPRRMARVSWDAVTNATGYVVEVKVFGETAWLDTACIKPPPDSPSHIVDQPNDGSDPKCDIDLDAITTDGGAKGLADNDAYTLQVTAMANAFAPSAPSRNIIIIDTPITRANGDSSDTGTGKAEFSWTTINSVLGNVYSSGFYQLRYRKASGDHTAPDWDPNDFNGFEEPRNNVSSPATIGGLDLHEVHAVQLVKRNSGPANDIDVFSARDVYVWPSTSQAADGSWIANMPVTAFLNDNTFTYRICTDTFSNETRLRKKDWETLIDHAFGQWQSALTGDFITIARESGPCANYDLIAQRWLEIIATEMPNLGSGLTDQEKMEKMELIEAFVRRIREENSDIAWRLRLLTSAANTADLEKSEVLMFDDVDGNFEDLIDVGVFPQMASDLGVPASCWYYKPDGVFKLDIGSGEGVALMCTFSEEISDSILGVIPINKRYSTDIFIRRSQFKNASLAVPTSDDVMNTCGSAGAVYSAFIHEIGHALGISRGNTDGPRTGENPGHPPEEMDGNTVMIYTNTGNYPRCAPYPLDLLAINALYQTVD